MSPGNSGHLCRCTDGHRIVKAQARCELGVEQLYEPCGRTARGAGLESGCDGHGPPHSAAGCIERRLQRDHRSPLGQYRAGARRRQSPHVVIVHCPWSHHRRHAAGDGLRHRMHASAVEPATDVGCGAESIQRLQHPAGRNEQHRGVVCGAGPCTRPDGYGKARSVASLHHAPRGGRGRLVGHYPETRVRTSGSPVREGAKQDAFVRTVHASRQDHRFACGPRAEHRWWLRVVGGSEHSVMTRVTGHRDTILRHPQVSQRCRVPVGARAPPGNRPPDRTVEWSEPAPTVCLLRGHADPDDGGGNAGASGLPHQLGPEIHAGHREGGGLERGEERRVTPALVEREKISVTHAANGPSRDRRRRIRENTLHGRTHGAQFRRHRLDDAGLADGGRMKPHERFFGPMVCGPRAPTVRCTPPSPQAGGKPSLADRGERGEKPVGRAIDAEHEGNVIGSRR